MLSFVVPAPFEWKPGKGGARRSGIWANANNRDHHQERAKKTKAWRQEGYKAAIRAGLPKGELGKWFVGAVVHLPRNVVYDAMNFYPSTKGLIDGVVGDYGFLPDDSNDYVLGPLCVRGVKNPDGVGHVELFLFDVVEDQVELLEWIKQL